MQFLISLLWERSFGISPRALLRLPLDLQSSFYKTQFLEHFLLEEIHIFPDSYPFFHQYFWSVDWELEKDVCCLLAVFGMLGSCTFLFQESCMYPAIFDSDDAFFLT